MGVWVSHLGVGAVTGQAAVKFHEKNKEKLKWFNEMGAYFLRHHPQGSSPKLGLEGTLLYITWPKELLLSPFFPATLVEKEGVEGKLLPC